VTDTQTLGASDTDWMAERRRKAARALPDIGMPSEREEIWRYLDLSFDPGFGSAATSAGPAAKPDDIVEGWQGTVVSIVDGFVVSDGVASVAEGSSPTVAGRDTDLFATAFTALAPGTAVVDGGMLQVPVLVDVQATGSATTFPGLHVDVPGGTTGTVIVRYRSATPQPSTVVPTITVNVGDNARLALTVVQDWNYQTRAIGRAIATLGRDASLVLSEIGLGAHLGRLHLDVDFVGNGSNAKIYGAYFGEEDQTLDYRYFMNHIGTNTRCDMFLKGAVEDQALSVFTGMIRIEESGQKTESFQTNKNLILSDGAAAQSVPNLEILANDVKCGHGSSVGPLDQDQKYYLMSRGLTSDRADRLQVHGFFEEVVGQLPDPAVAAWVRDRINHKFIAAQEEGRV
jgi:Fe-S cluster assembly protein SufD